MKHPLLLFLLLPCFCWGQYPVYNDLLPKDTLKSKSDTVRALMLVCDTSYVQTGIWYNYNGEQKEIKFMNKEVWWQFGYIVITERHPTLIGTGSVDIIVHQLEYLDENKKPLPKSLIIWITKEIK